MKFRYEHFKHTRDKTLLLWNRVSLHYMRLSAQCIAAALIALSSSVCVCVCVAKRRVTFRKKKKKNTSKSIKTFRHDNKRAHIYTHTQSAAALHTSCAIVKCSAQKPGVRQKFQRRYNKARRRPQPWKAASRYNGRIFSFFIHIYIGQQKRARRWQI